MSLLNQIEDKFGFKLPPSYRALVEHGTLDTEVELADGYMMIPRDLAEFEWEDFMNPIEGLVPFAYNGMGEPYCWLTTEPAADGEFAVIAAMDGGEGYYFAPSVPGTIFRDALHWYDMKANKEDLDQIYARLPALLEVFEPHTPEVWCDLLRSLKDRPTRENELGNPCLFKEAELNEIIRDCFGEAYVDREIVWETKA